MNLTKREAATVLAALRYWQADVTEEPEIVDGEMQIPIDFCEFFHGEQPLDFEEIDSLCERINCGEGDLRRIATDMGLNANFAEQTVEEVYAKLKQADTDHALVVQIRLILDGVDWTPDTIGEIGELLNSHGYPVRDLGANEAYAYDEEVCPSCNAGTHNRCTDTDKNEPCACAEREHKGEE